MINHAQMEGIQMSRRMNYGTRFGSGGFSMKYGVSDTPGYAETMARVDGIKMAAINANMPLHAKELAHYKAAVGNRKTAKRKTGKLKDERLEAERRMLEAMRKAVSILEFHMEELHRTRKIGSPSGLVNQHAIHNALVQLRTKCGVKFDPNEYDHHVDLAQLHMDNRRTEQQWLDDVRAEREQQRLARLRNMKAQAERFITKYRGTQ
jgi:hypothetical protein